MVAPPPAPPLDLHPIIATLRGGKATDAWVRSWLPDTNATPERFVEAGRVAQTVARLAYASTICRRVLSVSI